MRSYDEFAKVAGAKEFINKVTGRALRNTRRQALQQYKTSLRPYLKDNIESKRVYNSASEMYNRASDRYNSVVRESSKFKRANPELKAENDILEGLARAARWDRDCSEKIMLNAGKERPKTKQRLDQKRAAERKNYEAVIDKAKSEQTKARKQLATGAAITAGTLIGAGIIAKKIKNKKDKDEEKVAFENFTKSAQIESPSPSEKKHMNEDEKYVDAPVAEKPEKCAKNGRGLSRKDRDKILRMLNLKGKEK